MTSASIHVNETFTITFNLFSVSVRPRHQGREVVVRRHGGEVPCSDSRQEASPQNLQVTSSGEVHVYSASAASKSLQNEFTRPYWMCVTDNVAPGRSLSTGCWSKMSACSPGARRWECGRCWWTKGSWFMVRTRTGLTRAPHTKPCCGKVTSMPVEVLMSFFAFVFIYY